MASKDISKIKAQKGLGKDPSLCRLGQRMISAVLREERIAERDLQEKLKAISTKEHKSMVKLCGDSLEVRHDLSRQRSNSPVPGAGGEDVLDIANNKGSPVDLATMEGIRSLSLEMLNNTSSPDGKTSPPVPSPRLLNKRPVSEISQVSCSSEVDEVFVEKIMLEKGLLVKVPQKPTSPPLRGPHRPSTPPLRVPRCPSTPPPTRRSQTPLPADFRKPRSSSVRVIRPKSPALVEATHAETVRGRERMRLDFPQGSTPTRSRSPSPSPSRLSLEPLACNVGRRGSGPPRINANSLPPSSPQRKGLGTSDVIQGLTPNSPDALRRRLSANEEDLQDRVQGFLKTLGKSSK